MTPPEDRRTPEKILRKNLSELSDMRTLWAQILDHTVIWSRSKISLVAVDLFSV